MSAAERSLAKDILRNSGEIFSDVPAVGKTEQEAHWVRSLKNNVGKFVDRNSTNGAQQLD